MKRINKIFISFVLLFCLSLACKTCFGAEYEISDYKIKARVMNDSSLHVEEYLVYDFDSSMNGLYRDILYNYNFKNQKDNMEATSSRYQASRVSNIEAYYSNTGFTNLNSAIMKEEIYLSNGMNGYFSVEDYVDNGYRTKVKLYSPIDSGEKKYVKYVYDIEDVTVMYNNACELYWNFIGGDWQCDIENVEIEITFEGLDSMQNVIIYPHSYSRIDTYINDNKIYIKANNIPDKRAIDARIVFPRTQGFYSSKVIDEYYNMDKLSKIESKMEFDKSRYYISNICFVIIVLIAILTFIVIIVLSSKEVSKGRKKKKDLGYYRDVLNNYSLDIYNLLLGSFHSYSNNTLFLATILDLVNKEYIIMNAKKKENKKFGDKVEYDYFMELNKEADYNKLTKYEILIINFLFNEKAEFGSNIAGFKHMSIELNEQLKINSKNYLLSKKLISKYQLLDKEKIDKIYNNASEKLKKITLVNCLIIILLLFVNIFLISPLNFDLKIDMIGMSCFIVAFYAIINISIAFSTKSMKQEYIDEADKLKELEKYLKEYSLIKDRYPIELKLWNKYLVFASLFGIADKVSKELKEELIKNGYSENSIYMNYPIYSIAANSIYISNSISSSTGTSSSGGSSGGGSGGGGRRRRWWRSILG